MGELAALPTPLCGEGALTKLVTDVVNAAAALPAGGPFVFLRVSVAGPGATVDITTAAAAALRAGAVGLILCSDRARPDSCIDAILPKCISDVYRQTDGRLVLIA